MEFTWFRFDPATGRVDPDDIRRALRPVTRLIVLQHASNVTGVIQPIEDVARIAREHAVVLLIDAAQTAGHLPIDVAALGIDLLAFPGHKGLLGPLGTGGLYIRPGLEREIAPLTAGGTGSISEVPIQPEHMPDRFESGSHNAIGLAGLSAALQWLGDRGPAALRSDDEAMSEHFLARLADVDGLTLFGPRDPRQRVPVFSVRIDGFDPAELSAVLESEFGILTRSGIHCAPWAHETLSTAAGGGTTRFSFGPFNTEADVDACVDALGNIAVLT
jgi:selenocysteine lyase/cysteine desulfurase